MSDNHRVGDYEADYSTPNIEAWRDNLVNLAEIRDAMAIKSAPPEVVPVPETLADFLFLQARLNGHMIDCLTEMRIRLQIAEEKLSQRAH
jgi:hypothetical protein